MTTAYLVDTSALSRLRVPAVSAAIEPLVQSGAVGMCAIQELELLYGARNYEAGRQLLEDMRLRFETVPTTQADFYRAAAVMLALSQAGQHRSAALPDLLIAAVAERRGLAIVHYDQGFDHIAESTGQPATWVVPRGSI